MTDDQIRQPLLGAQGFAPVSRPGTVRVLRSRVIAAGGHPDELDRWVTRHRGAIEPQPGVQSQALGQPPWARGPRTPDDAWYAVPAPALGL